MIEIRALCRDNDIVRPVVTQELVEGKWHTKLTHPVLHDPLTSVGRTQLESEEELPDLEPYLRTLINPKSKYLDQKSLLTGVEVVMTRNEPDANTWLLAHVLGKVDAVGFDMKSAHKIGLLQVFVPGSGEGASSKAPQTLVHCVKSDQTLPERMVELLKNVNILKYCYSPERDLYLLREKCRLKPRGFVDVRDMIPYSSGYTNTMSLDRAAKVFLGVELKERKRSEQGEEPDWVGRYPRENEVEIAAVEVTLAYRLAQHLCSLVGEQITYGVEFLGEVNGMIARQDTLFGFRSLARR